MPYPLTPIPYSQSGLGCHHTGGGSGIGIGTSWVAFLCPSLCVGEEEIETFKIRFGGGINRIFLGKKRNPAHAVVVRLGKKRNPVGKTRRVPRSKEF